MRFLKSLWDALFGCCHPRTTFPMTKERRTYVVCLTCGDEFNYDWKRMKIGSPIPQTAPYVSVQEDVIAS